MTLAFGIKRNELLKWKNMVKHGKIAFLTHYWQDDRFPGCYTVTKVGCNDLKKLIAWAKNMTYVQVGFTTTKSILILTYLESDRKIFQFRKISGITFIDLIYKRRLATRLLYFIIRDR